MDRYDRRVLLFPTEASAGLGLDHDGLLIGELECPLQGTMDVVGALQRSDDSDCAVRFGDRDGALRLDVQLFLQTHPERTLNHLHILRTLQILKNLALPDFYRAK